LKVKSFLVAQALLRRGFKAKQRHIHTGGLSDAQLEPIIADFERLRLAFDKITCMNSFINYL